jgi:cell division protein FtsZ
MIEFTQDGPFADKADQLFPDRVRILGLGQTGAAVCDQLVLHGRTPQDLWVFDSDQMTIEASVVPNRHLLGRSLVHGLGCSGDIELAREIVAIEEARLASVAKGCDFLILVLGLAGSTGVAAAERMIELGREAGAKVIVIGVLPFAFEGLSRREKAVQAMADLRREADSVLILSNDRLADHPETLKNIRHGFHLMNQQLSKTTQALAQIVCKRGLIQLSFADVRSLYGRYTGSEVLENCWVAHVEGSIRNCTEELIDELLESPLLSDESIWKQVDHAVVAVSGTRNLGLTDVQELVCALKDRLPVNIPIATSASLDDESHDKVRLSVLFATTAPVLVPEKTPAEKAAHAKKSRPVTETARMPSVPAKVKPQPPVTEAASKKTTRLPKAKPAPAPIKNEPVRPEEISALVKAENAPLPAPAGASTGAARRFIAKQEEMQFEAPTRGRFEKTHETMYRGENLDQPTFRRRGVKIRV